LYIFAAFLDILTGKPRRQLPTIKYYTAAGEHGGQVRIFQHTLNLTLNPVSITDIVSTLNSIEFTSQFFKTAIQGNGCTGIRLAKDAHS
jgi:hypothetical protein